MEQLPDSLPRDPLPLLRNWVQEAIEGGGLPNADAMTLATVNHNHEPAARVVLCKEIVSDPGYIVFYTNYNSAKSLSIADNSKVAAVFHWDHLNRQVRLEGIAVKSPAEESDTYFASRDKESQIGAWASAQSEPIDSRQVILNKHAATARKLSDLALDSGIMAIPRPPFWGGYRIWLTAIELWTRGNARLHDRARWERAVKAGADGQLEADSWTATRLQP
jgi:pyridoxamine 5'-phosphate oxidase